MGPRVLINGIWYKARLDGIAGLNERFQVRYSYKVEDLRNRGRYFDGTDAVVLTWSEIFAACGPNFFRPTSPKFIPTAILTYLRENNRIDQQRTSLQIFGSDENQIKIQLLALGLITIEAAEAKDDGVQEFASLTQRGHQQLLELLAVRGTDAKT